MIIRFLCLLARLTIAPFCRLEVRDPHNVSTVGPCIIVANHRSLFDVLVGMTAFRWRTLYPQVMVAREWLPGPLGWLARRSGVIPVDRKGGTSAREAGVMAVDAGGRILIMPEGKLHWDPAHPYAFGPVRPGMVRVARATGAPIVPVAVEGTQHVWPKGALFPRPVFWRRPLVKVSIGAPWHPGNGDDQAEADAAMEEIRRLLHELAA